MGALTPEGKIKRMVTDLLKRYDIWYFLPGNNGFGRSGIPDIIAIVHGQFTGIEVKADKTKKPTELQKLCGRQIQAAGGHWFLVYDKHTTAAVEQWIKDSQHVDSREGESHCAQAEQPESGIG
jgi:hypothetical protein